MQAILGNADHPEYGVATIPLPIPREQYDHCVELLDALEIGNASKADCRVASLDSSWPVLNRLINTKVNLDELDYLAKRLDSFAVGEFSQFQAMAEKLHLTSMKDLINLTFCCQQATVITDFTNLKEVGRDHYMNINGGCASMEELEQLDGEETAILLIEDNEGTITRYGVVYDNGMQLSQLFDGKHLPCYHYEADMTAVGISSRWEPENSRNVTWIYLPASKGQIERAMQRSGIADPKDMRLFMADSSFPEEVDVELDISAFTDPTTKNAADLVTYAIHAWESGWGYVWGTYGSVLTESLLDYKIEQYPDGVGTYEDFIRANWLGGRTTDCVGLIKGYGWLNPDTMTIEYGTNGMPDLGANQMYYNASVSGTIDTMPDTPGLAVWHDGHIGVYIGDGYVIEAMGTKYGVVKTELEGRGWTHWLQIEYINYD